MSDAEEIDSLLEDIRSGDENRLISASPMLAQFGSAVVPSLVDTLQSEQPLVRDYSAMSLGLIGSPAEPAIPALCVATRDINSSVRYTAIVALGRIGRPTAEVVTCLNAALADPDPMNQKGARNALRELDIV
jgi:HEAT repeat protein